MLVDSPPLMVFFLIDTSEPAGKLNIIYKNKTFDLLILNILHLVKPVNATLALLLVAHSFAHTKAAFDPLPSVFITRSYHFMVKVVTFLVLSPTPAKLKIHHELYNVINQFHNRYCFSNSSSTK